MRAKAAPRPPLLISGLYTALVRLDLDTSGAILRIAIPADALTPAPTPARRSKPKRKKSRP